MQQNKRSNYFLVQDILLVPHSECKRKVDYLTWPGKYIEEAIERERKTILVSF